MKKKALIVDDNANNLLLEKDLLEVSGFEVFEAENAGVGIAIARKESWMCGFRICAAAKPPGYCVKIKIQAISQ
jgi:CheY-like chemotaxis protein